MAIFNSLGSNYDFGFVLKALFGKSLKSDREKLRELLKERYGGESVLFYKGREALTYALKILNLPYDSEVAINGFTCVAVFNAIRKAGFEPSCLDLGKEEGLNFSPETLEKALEKNKNIKVVIIQNTLGYPCDIVGIKKICETYNLILIEDLAHCVGAKYKGGIEAGTIGDIAVLSFSQDKIIDAVSGGAIIVRSKKYQKNVGRILFKTSKNQIKDRIYPYLTYKIRYLYKLGLGKPYHFLLMKLNLLSNVMRNDLYDFFDLPNWNSGMALYAFNKLASQLTHRKKITKIYVEGLHKNIISKHVVDTVLLSSNLRVPIYLDDRNELLKLLKGSGIYLSDIWYYDVAPECPNAVSISKRILNLPTHVNISEKDAYLIVKLINQWIQK